MSISNSQNPAASSHFPSTALPSGAGQDDQPDKSHVAIPQSALAFFMLGMPSGSPQPSSQTPAVPGAVASGSVGSAAAVVPSTHSPSAGPYTALKAGPGREAPDAVNKAVRLGDVAYFDAAGGSRCGHAEMCVGFDKDGKALWCSDTYQGASFFANANYQNGSYTIYHCGDPKYNAQQAAATIMRNAAPTYTEKCALEVREAEEKGLGHGLGAHPVDAKGYNRSDTLQHSGFSVVLRGGPGAGPPMASAGAHNTVASAKVAAHSIRPPQA